MRLPYVLALAPLLLSAAVQADDCASATTQSAMNQCAANQFKQAESQLNALYKQINSRLQNSPDSKKRLVSAQRAWVAFRDAECAFAASGVEGGSVYPLVHSGCLADLTDKRVAAFKTYLDCQEGDLSCPVR